MQNIEINVEKAAPVNSIPYLDKEHGYFQSANVTKDPEEVFRVCQDKASVEKVLSNLPQGIKNFFDLRLVSSDQSGPGDYRLRWENKPKSVSKGELIFILKKSPIKKGTIITVEAIFDKIKFKEEGPSTLMNIFIKRMKALIETGVLPTTEGQPSGRKEISSSSNKNLH